MCKHIAMENISLAKKKALCMVREPKEYPEALKIDFKQLNMQICIVRDVIAGNKEQISYPLQVLVLTQQKHLGSS
jgi:hypothetical protein